MKKVMKMSYYVMTAILLVCIVVPGTQAQEMYDITFGKIQENKAFFDDDRPLYNHLGLEKTVPAEVYSKLVYDTESMKTVWADTVGFKAPDVVGKVASQIKPGTYTYKDKEKLPFKELMIPKDYERFTPGAPPFVGNFSSIKVVPTRQYYWALPIGEATKENAGKTELNSQGYMNYDSYVSGIPFPQPSGDFQAQQIMYNWEKRYLNWESSYAFMQVHGFNDKMQEDFVSQMAMYAIKLHGRITMEPQGWFDDRSKMRKENRQILTSTYSPRDLYGNCFSILGYLDSNKSDQPVCYINAMRKLRKMSGTDTQDPMGGQDYIYLDGDGFNQKLTPDNYPYEYEVVGEREYLVPAYTVDGTGYFSSTTNEVCDYEFERRPVYVVKLTQKEPSFVYGHRMLYFDKETHVLLRAENYNQKGDLYRDMSIRYAFHRSMGMLASTDLVARDYIDKHSMFQTFYVLPMPHMGREDISLRSMQKMK